MAKRTKRKQTAIARRVSRQREIAVREPVADGQLGVFQRMARDPDLTVEKLGELIRLQERIEDRNAAKSFDAAYREMLPQIPRIKKNGKILNKQKEVQSHYAKYEDIRRVVDPIMQRHGFTFHPHTDWPDGGGIPEIVGTLEHRDGGKRISRFRAKSDESGGKNAIQGLGSAVSYGKRYTLIDLLSIVCEGQDDDGQAAGSRRRSTPDIVDVPSVRETERPAGYDKGRGDVITEMQRKRLGVIAENSGRTAAEISAWLLQRFGWSTSREITRDKYDVICSALEAPGSLS